MMGILKKVRDLDITTRDSVMVTLRHQDDREVHRYTTNFSMFIDCPKGNRSSDLKNHILTYTGDKPHKWKFCDFMCARKANLLSLIHI